MPYHIEITEVTSRPERTGFTVHYAVHDDAVAPSVVVDTGSVGMIFDTVGTAQERRQRIRDYLVAHFTNVIGRMEAGDADYSAIRTALVGLRYPPL